MLKATAERASKVKSTKVSPIAPKVVTMTCVYHGHAYMSECRDIGRQRKGGGGDAAGAELCIGSGGKPESLSPWPPGIMQDGVGAAAIAAAEQHRKYKVKSYLSWKVGGATC